MNRSVRMAFLACLALGLAALAAAAEGPPPLLDRELFFGNPEIAAAQLDQARAAIRAAEQQVRDAVITAPFAGIVTAKLRNAGDTVTLMPVSPIVALTDIEHLEVRLTVPEALEPAIHPGQEIEGTSTPGGRRFQAKVRVKSAVVDPVTRTV